jgi:hypothetical protein
MPESTVPEATAVTVRVLLVADAVKAAATEQDESVTEVPPTVAEMGEAPLPT